MGKKLSLPLGAIALLAALFGFTGSASAAGESISGTVTDSSGGFVNDYCVTATRYGPVGSLVLAPVRTQPNGTYTIPAGASGMTAGEFTLLFSRCGSGDSVPSNGNLIPEYWDDKPDLATADHFTVGDGEVVTGKNAVLQIGATISGVISGPGGPIDGCVSLYGPGVAAGIQTGPTGVYEYERLRAGDYHMIFDDCGDDGLSYEWYDNKPTESSSDTITLVAAESRTIDATLSAGGTISGTVTDSTDSALPGICVDLYDADDREVTGERTDVAGHFSFGGLPPGSYRTFYYDCDHRDNVASEYYDDAATLATADPIVVASVAASS